MRSTDDLRVLILADARDLGTEIRRARAEQGLRQEDLAFTAGVSRRLLQQVEAGKPSVQLDTLAKIVEVFGLRLALVSKQLRRAPPMLDTDDDE